MKPTKTPAGRDKHPWDMKPDDHLKLLALGSNRHHAERAEEELRRRELAAREAARHTPPLFPEFA